MKYLIKNEKMLLKKVKSLLTIAEKEMDEELIHNLHSAVERISNSINQFGIGVELIKRGRRDEGLELIEYSRATYNDIKLYIDIVGAPIVPAGSQRVDSMTKDTVSAVPVTRDFLKENYEVTGAFGTVSLNSINEALPSRLSSKALNKCIVECFPEVKSRKLQGDIKYSLKSL